MRNILFFLLFCIVFLYSDAGRACASTQPDNAGERWILDHDADLDDFTAIMMMFLSPKAKVIGMVVSPNGCSYYGDAWKNTVGLLRLLGVDPAALPTAMGEREPLNGYRAFPAAWRIGADEVCGDALPPARLPVPETRACDLYIRLLNAAKEKVSILCIGPMTNLALALQKAPAIKKKIKRVVAMAGALRAPGNIIVPGFTDAQVDTVSEWNCFIDPVAVEIVLNSGLDITLVPLDATNQAPVEQSFMQRFIASAETPVARFQAVLFKNKLGAVETGEFYFWDPLAAGIALDDSLAVEMRRERISVRYSFLDGAGSGSLVDPLTLHQFPPATVDGGRRRRFDPRRSGQIIPDPVNGAPATVCGKTDVESFKKLFSDLLGGVRGAAP